MVCPISIFPVADIWLDMLDVMRETRVDFKVCRMETRETKDRPALADLSLNKCLSVADIWPDILDIILETKVDFKVC